MTDLGVRVLWPDRFPTGHTGDLGSQAVAMLVEVVRRGGAVGYVEVPDVAEGQRWLGRLEGMVSLGQARVAAVVVVDGDVIAAAPGAGHTTASTTSGASQVGVAPGRVDRGRADHSPTAAVLQGAWSGRLMALGRWERLGSPPLRHGADLRQVMVHPAARGRGLARLLVSELVADARRAGLEVLTLDVRGNNHAAMALYEAAGFLVTGRVPDLVAVGDERFDMVSYRLDLRTGSDVLRRHGGRAEGLGAAPLRPDGTSGGTALDRQAGHLAEPAWRGWAS